MAASIPSLAQTSGSLVELIRRDLKLGDDVEITECTQLFGGDLDLDSLDALLLVQSIEREFGIKVASDAIGPEVFHDLTSLSQFVAEQVAQQGS